MIYLLGIVDSAVSHTVHLNLPRSIVVLEDGRVDLKLFQETNWKTMFLFRTQRISHSHSI